MCKRFLWLLSAVVVLWAAGAAAAQPVDVNVLEVAAISISSGPTEQYPERTKYWYECGSVENWNLEWADQDSVFCTGTVPTGGATPIMWQWNLSGYACNYEVVTDANVTCGSPWGAWENARYRMVMTPEPWAEPTNWDSYVGAQGWQAFWQLPGPAEVGMLIAQNPGVGWWDPAFFSGTLPGSVVQEWLDNPGKNYGITLLHKGSFPIGSCMISHGATHAGPGPMLAFTAVKIPDLPSAASPASGASDVPPCGTVLSWAAGDYAASHDVYFGTKFDDVNDASRASDPNNVLVSQGQLATTYPAVGSMNLEYGTTYYWRIDEVNITTSVPYKGKMWYFTTTGGKANTPSPRDGLVDLELPILLSWQPGAYAAQHDIYFGENLAAVTDANISNQLGVYITRQSEPNYAPSTVLPGKTYYWRIDEFNDLIVCGPNVIKGDVWSFSMLGSGPALFPVPGDGSTAPDLTAVVLKWRPGDWVASTGGHDLYFGTDSADVNDANKDDTPRVLYANRDVNDYDPKPLEFETTYYWRVDEINDPCLWKGTVWSFTTPGYLTIDDFDSYPDDANLYVNWNPDFPWDYPVCSAGRGTGAWCYDSGDAMQYLYDNNGNPEFDYDKYSDLHRDFGPAGVDWTVGSASKSPKILAFSYTGAMGNSADAVYDRMYAGVEDTLGHFAMVNNPDPNAQLSFTQKEWSIDLADFNNAGVDLSKVRYLSIGFGKRCNLFNSSYYGGDGEVIIDDIRLYPAKCVPEYGPTGDLTNDCRVNIDDLDFMMNEWLSADGNRTISPIEQPNSPVLWYEFDDGNDANVTDSANDYNGVLTHHPYGGAPIEWHSSGGYDDGGYIEFPGQGGVVDIPNDVIAETVTENLTVSVWIKCDADNFPQTGSWTPLMRADGTSSTESGFDIWCPTPFPPLFDVGPQVHYRFNGGESSDPGDDLASCSDYWVKFSDFTGRWQHWAFVKDGTNDWIAIYHDGVLACDAVSDANNIGQIQTGLIHLCSFNSAASPSWAGGVDDLRFYNSALSAAEIGYLTTSGTGNIYLPLGDSPVDLYVEDPNAINFKDFSVLSGHWMEEILWP